MAMQKKIGGMTYTRQVPNFLAKMQQAAMPDGIEGALKRRALERGDEEPEDRSEDEEERPVVVGEADALTSKQRRQDAAGAAREEARGGTLKFKRAESTAGRFEDSAAKRVRLAEEAQAAAAAESEAQAAVPTDSAGHTFSAGAASKKPKEEKKKLKRAGAGVGAKAVKNAKLLSFEEDD